MTTLVPLTYATLARLPARIGARTDFNGPVPPDPFRPIATPCRLWTGWFNSSGYGYTGWRGRPGRPDSSRTAARGGMRVAA